jgi:hypothetical protein
LTDANVVFQVNEATVDLGNVMESVAMVRADSLAMARSESGASTNANLTGGTTEASEG